MKPKNTKTPLISFHVPDNMASMIIFLAESSGMTDAEVITKLLKTGIETMRADFGGAAKRRIWEAEKAALVAKLDAFKAQLDAVQAQLDGDRAQTDTRKEKDAKLLRSAMEKSRDALAKREAGRRMPADEEAAPVAQLEAKPGFFDVLPIRLVQGKAGGGFFDYPFDPVKPPS